MQITILAGSTAKIPFRGIPGIARIPVDFGRNTWRTVKNSIIFIFLYFHFSLFFIFIFPSSGQNRGVLDVFCPDLLHVGILLSCIVVCLIYITASTSSLPQLLSHSTTLR